MRLLFIATALLLTACNTSTPTFTQEQITAIQSACVQNGGVNSQGLTTIQNDVAGVYSTTCIPAK